MSAHEQIVIRNASGSHDLSFPVSDRVDPLSAVLTLHLSNSNVLHQDRSQLVVTINDFYLGQIKLDPLNPTRRVEFRIDPEYLRRGYNKLSFRAAQHYTDSECEDWSAPELWTQLDTVKSTLQLNYRRSPVIEKLSEIDRLINDRLGDYSATILRGTETVTGDYLYWGAVIAQGLKLRLKYVPMTIEERFVRPYHRNPEEIDASESFKIDSTRLTGDAIILGDKESIGALLPEPIKEAINGPYLGLFRQDENPYRFFLVISGRTNDEVKMAAQTFALLDAPFPNERQTIVSRLDFPVKQPLYPFNSVAPGKAYALSDLNFADTTLNAGSSETRINFKMPADIYSTEDAMVRLSLNLAHGAAMRKDSVINVALNDKFVHVIPLKEETGAHYHDYSLSIPLRNFKPGVNKLTFNAVLTPSEYGECAFVQRGNLWVSLYQDSTIAFPDAARLADMPDLKLFERTGFPFIDNGSAKNTTFRLIDGSSDSIASAWHLIGHLAAFDETPIFDLNITGQAGDSKGNIVLIGKTKSDDTSVLLNDAPVQLGKSSRFPYRFKEDQQTPEESLLDWLERIVFNPGAGSPAVTAAPANVVVEQSAGLGDGYLLMSYLPDRQDGVALALVSEHGTDLYPGVVRLTSPELWSQLQGNLFIWDKHDRHHWTKEGRTAIIGDGTIKMTWIKHFSNHPWQWLILIGVLLILIAWIIHKLLNRYKQATHR